MENNAQVGARTYADSQFSSTKNVEITQRIEDVKTYEDLMKNENITAADKAKILDYKAGKITINEIPSENALRAKTQKMIDQQIQTDIENSTSKSDLYTQ